MKSVSENRDTAERNAAAGSSGIRRSLYGIAQWTWGLPQTLAGAGLFLAHRNDDHFDYHGARVTVWDRKTGISLGKYVFVPRLSGKAGEFILVHEYGHTIQSLILGPAYLPLVGLPSILWHRMPAFKRYRNKTGKSYYSVFFENTANALGARKHRHK